MILEIKKMSLHPRSLISTFLIRLLERIVIFYVNLQLTKFQFSS